MTDYKEEQANELEALESIYPDELQMISSNPTAFTLSIQAKGEYGEIEHEASCDIQFTYTPTYPDELPVVEIVTYDNLEDEHLNMLIELMTSEGQDNLGMVMVFTMVSAAQERLIELVESIAQNAQEEKHRKQEELEEKERKRFEGTLVTIETFLAWKRTFDEEREETKRRLGLDKKGPLKPTGKELFMNDHTLDDSDVKFLEEEGDAVQVDESLFQDLDDLDLDDDLDES